MRSTRIRRPSPALIVSCIALLVALGGTSYAAFSLPKNSVGTKQLKKNAVTASKIKNGAVTASKINTSGLTVPNASHANGADSATTAATATTAINATSLGGQSASAFALATPITPTAATLENGWTAAANLGTPGFAKDQFGIVHLFGAASNSAANTTDIFQLPAGDRPASLVDVPVAFSTATAGVLRINPNGTLRPASTATNFVGLEGVTFLAGG